jgi:branched-chain amino acid transport system substrate-binding protein
VFKSLILSLNIYISPVLLIISFMKRSNKIIIGIIVVFCICLGLAFRFTDSSPIKIGVILPLSGELSSIGENAKNGALLAYSNLSTSTRQKVSLIFEDDKFDAKNTVSAFNKLAVVDKVSAIVCLTSTPCAAVAPLADQLKIPLIAVASAPVQIGHDFVVRLELSPLEEGKSLAQYVEHKSYTKIAAVVAIQDGAKTAYASFAENDYVKNHTVIHTSVSPAAKDLRSDIAKVLTTSPDVIVVGLLPGSAGIFAKQLRQLGYRGDLVGFNTIEGEETLTAAQGAIEGIVYTQATDPTAGFTDLYLKAYGTNPGPGSAHVHDATKMLAGIIESGGTDSPGIIKNLKSIKNFSGAFGMYSSVPGGEFGIPVIFKTVKEWQFVRLEK